MNIESFNKKTSDKISVLKVTSLYALIVAKIVIVTSCVVMVGWFFDIGIFKSILPDFVTMKFVTALSFLLSGIILLLVNYKSSNDSSLIDIMIPSTSFLIAMIMGTTLLSVVFGFQSGIEKIFVIETSDAILTPVPGRPSIGTMAGFMLATIVGFISFTTIRKKNKIYFLIGNIISLLGIVALVGYIFSVPELYYSAQGISSAMAVHTAALFVLVGTGFVSLSKQISLYITKFRKHHESTN